jgi:hypothetical protein
MAAAGEMAIGKAAGGEQLEWRRLGKRLCVAVAEKMALGRRRVARELEWRRLGR